MAKILCALCGEIMMPGMEMCPSCGYRAPKGTEAYNNPQKQYRTPNTCGAKTKQATNHQKRKAFTLHNFGLVFFILIGLFCFCILLSEGELFSSQTLWILGFPAAMVAVISSDKKTPKGTTVSAETYGKAEVLLDNIKDCADKVNSATDVHEFFENLRHVLEGLTELSEFPSSLFATGSPQADMDELAANKPSLINDFMDRVYREAMKELRGCDDVVEAIEISTKFQVAEYYKKDMPEESVRHFLELSEKMDKAVGNTWRSKLT